MGKATGGLHGAGVGLWHDETGATSLEYALMLAVIVMSAVVSYQALGRVTGDSATGAGRLLDVLAGRNSDSTAASRLASPTR